MLKIFRVDEFRANLLQHMLDFVEAFTTPLEKI